MALADFHETIRRHAARLSRSTDLNAAGVEREVAAVPDPPITVELLEHACGPEAYDPPIEPHLRLLRALVLRRAIQGTEHAQRWQGPLTYEAALALQQLSSVTSLYPLRLEILDDLIDHGGPPDLLAEWYYARGNTKRYLSGTPASVEGIEDFQRAIVYAVDGQNSDMLAFATSAFAKVVAMLPEDVAGEHTKLARAFIDAALEIGLEGFNRALILQAHARLVRRSDPKAAAQALAAAVALVPRDNRFRLELAAEHVSQSSLTEPSEAIADLGLHYLAQETDLPCIELGLLHAAVGQATLALGRDEAKHHFEEGLACFRGRDLHNELEARIQLASIAIRAEDWEALDEQLRLIRAHESRLSPPQRLDVVRLEAASHKARGRLDEHRASVERLGDLTYDSEQRLRTRLEQAQLELADGRAPTADLDALIVEAIEQHAENEPILGLVVDTICNSKHPLETSTLDRVAAWAVARQMFTVVAHIQHRTGNTAGARDTLRQALGVDLSSRERLGCLHMLMCLLEDGDVEERKRIHPEIERMLDLDDVPDVRIDLATSLQREAALDPDALPRAWYHARRAVEGTTRGPGLLPRDEATLTHTCSTAVQILLALLQARLPESSPEIAEMAAWLGTDLPLPQSDRGETRVKAVILLLVPGPVCHAAALEHARRLLALARADLGDIKAVQMSGRRLAWIFSRIESRTTDPAPDHSQWKGGPFDAAPQWLVDMVAGRLDEVEPAAIGQQLDLLHHVLLARLDVADAVLAHLVGRCEAMAAPDAARLLNVALEVVQRVHWQGTGSKPWSGLQRVVNEIAVRSRLSSLQTLAATIARARGEAPPTAAAPGLDGDDPDRILTWSMRAVALMDQVRRGEAREIDQSTIDQARELLTRAVDVARSHQRPELRSCLISLGNAWKMKPSEDIGRALAYYDQAGALPATEPDLEGQLYKVKADALILRGTSEDLREAEKLLERAVDLRTGRFKAEALASLGKLLDRHPDLSVERRLERSAEVFLEAARVDGEFGAQLLPLILSALDRWRDHQPKNPRPDKLRAELARLIPDKAKEIDHQHARFSEGDIAVIAQAMEHPATRALNRTTSRLQTAEQMEASLEHFKDHLGPAELGTFREQHARESLIGDTEGLQAELERLAQEKVDEAARPGIVVARAVVLAELTRAGHAAATAVRQATAEAMSALHGVVDTKIRAFIITRLAQIWIPHDHAHDPVRDFGFAVEMLQEAVSIQGGEDHALIDTIEFLARAHRYASTGDPTANLSESRRLYQTLLARARRQGHSDLAANALHCLTELEEHLGEGDRTERTNRTEQLYLEAIEAAPSPIKRAEYTANLALSLTQAGGRLQGAAREAKLIEALRTFDRVDTSVLDLFGRRCFDTNRVLCETMIDQDRGNRSTCIRKWRRHIETLGDDVRVQRASSQHNLALVFLRDDHITPDELREALGLFEEAARVRTLENNARHRWETALDIGRAVARAMDPSDPLPAEGLPWAPDEAWNQARRWLGEAATAAGVLGPGSELAEVGHWLTALTASAASTELALDVGEQAWQVLDAATPYLVTSTASREIEARMSYRAAFTLARRLAAGSQMVIEPGQARWVLDGEEATPALRWILRAQQATRRAVRARLARPRGVSATAWSEWQQALQGPNPAQRVEVLRRLRQVAPSFLADASDLESTWRWLDARPGAIAVAVALQQSEGLVLVARLDQGHRRLSLLGVDVEKPPSDPRRLPEEMDEVIEQGLSLVPYAELAVWARRTIVEPLTTLIGHTPNAVLWVPDPWLRLVPPSAIWGEVPIAAATSIDLLDPYIYPGRHPSTLIGLADPGDLAPEGLTAFRGLVDEATRHGPVRQLASSGTLHGAALVSGPNVRDTPASIKDLLAESPEHRTLVLIAHGYVPDPMNAAIVCVNEDGQTEYLGVHQLAAQADAFAGAQVILLSCGSGLVGLAHADAGGLAGTLVSAGARWVVAPLWPITVATAQDVGCELLGGLAAGDEPWEILARPCAEEADEETASVQRASFVTWVG